MKKSIILLGIFLSLFLLFSGPVLAKEGYYVKKTAAEIEAHKAELRRQKAGEIEAHKAELRRQKAGEIETYKEKLKQQKAEKKEKFLEKKENLKEKLQQKRSDVAARHGERLSRRFAVYTKRLTSLADKIEARMTKLFNKGKDTSSVSAKLSEARSAIANAQSYGDQAVAKFNSIDPDTYDTQREIALAAKDLANQARNQYKQALFFLKEAVMLMKDLK